MKKRSKKMASPYSDPVREDIRHLGVIIEDVQRQVYLLAEGQTALRQDVDNIKQTLNEHTLTLAEHSRILAYHSKILDEHSQSFIEIRQTLDEHSKDLREIRHDLKRKVDYDEFSPWTQRVLLLEKKG